MTLTESFTPEKALQLKQPATEFLCSSNNSYGVTFESFVITNSNHDVFFAIGTADDSLVKKSIGTMSIDLDMDASNEPDMYRKIKYSFPASLLGE